RGYLFPRDEIPPLQVDEIVLEYVRCLTVRGASISSETEELPEVDWSCVPKVFIALYILYSYRR
ncbi:MAG: hypothetical protein KAT65_10655, partial [Methanophagales archaeon]|nr:hypothetical protein [Methanophagales archaeon]